MQVATKITIIRYIILREILKTITFGRRFSNMYVDVRDYRWQGATTDRMQDARQNAGRGSR